VLLLVDEDGHAAPLLASELISQLRDRSRLPRPVFLASCQSAGAGADRRSEDVGVLAAVGPRLAELGVPNLNGELPELSTLDIRQPGVHEERDSPHGRRTAGRRWPR
jgi:hypothetical protein